MIYDRNFQPLVGETVEAVAAVPPWGGVGGVSGQTLRGGEGGLHPKLAQRLPF